MKLVRNNHTFIDSQKMKKAALCDFFHQLSSTQLLLLNFTNGFGVWDAAVYCPESASISESTAIAIWKSKPKA
ncbi:MAG: hypothetical protein NUV54_01675 [Candidatus Taylorbacteria bacterium]|nr:hypothetical protein [Candidatus Taylorbacteria bacterium]